MTGLLLSGEFSRGWNDVLSPQNEHLAHLACAVLDLEAGDEETWDTGNREYVLAVLTGTCTVRCDGHEWRDVGGRDAVFDGRCHAVYLPPGLEVTVEASTATEIALPSSPTEGGGEPFEVPPGENRHNRRGGDGFRRDVYDVIGPDHDARRMLVGETVNEPGNWSSYPPHKHDVHDPPDEARLEEFYLFRLRPRDGFAYQRLYSEDRTLDENYAVGHDDLVLIPRGYHPVSAPPGFEVYYLWVLAGRGRELLLRTDPSFEHLR